MFGTKPAPQSKELLAIVNGDFEELLQAKQTIDAEIAKRSAAELENQKGKLAAMASALGVSIASMFGISEKQREEKKRRKRQVYVNPDNPEETYTAGKHPEWLKEKLEAGHTKEEFLKQ